MSGYGRSVAAPEPAPARGGGVGVPRPGRGYRFPLVMALVILAVVLLAIAPWDLLLPKVAVSGSVRDAVSDEPLAGARVAYGPATVATGPDGTFAVGRASLTESLVAESDGYHPAEVSIFPPRQQSIRLAPRSFWVTARNAETGEPVAGASAAAREARASVADPGRFRVEPARPGTAVALTAPGFRDASVTFLGDQESLVVDLQPRLLGSVVDGATGRPIPRAFVAADGVGVAAGEDGAFELERRPSGPVRILAPGYRRAEVDYAPGRPLDARLEPIVVKALYLTLYGVADRGLRQNALDLIEKTEANALVIDVKGDRGKLAYRSAVPLAEAIGANDEPTIGNVEELLATLKQRNIYTIARVVVFKDDMLARNGPRAGFDVAVKDGSTNEPWIDGEKLAWVDPLRQEAWEYNIALAREAALKGFDEVQFDYVRFPTDPAAGSSMAAARFSRRAGEEERVAAITTFLKKAHAEVRVAGAYLGADIFGYVPWDEGDLGIGQQFEAVAANVDYVCPMVYPSTYQAGLPGMIGFPGVVAKPYEVVFESMRRAQARAAGTGSVMRPWLQYFDDYPWQTGRRYNAAEVAAQRKAAADAGSIGWMLWDPANRYARGGLEPRR